MVLFRSLRFAAVLIIVSLVTSRCKADETHTRYFEQLRQRSLYSLAVAEAIARLTDQSLTPSEQSDLTIQLSKTLAEQAGTLPDDQRDETWGRARSVIEELLEQNESSPRARQLRGQLASVWITESNWFRSEAEFRRSDEVLTKRTRASATQGIEILRSIERKLIDPPADSSGKKSEKGVPTNHEVRLLLHHVRWELASAYRNLAELSPAASPDRSKSAATAEQYLKQLIDVADEPLQTRARVLSATCARLVGKLDRASELLSNVEKNEAVPSEETLAERARVRLEQQRPTDAAQLLLKTRGKRQRLTGELWFLQTRSLIALRDVTIEKQQETLSEQLADQIATAIERCEEQVGGYWARRCRALWDDSLSAEKYGPELDALMQQARTDFISGRIDAALDKYASAELAAKSKGQTDLAMELGFTRASILLDQKNFETAAEEYFRLAVDFSSSPRAANAHILGTYSLGRAYDANRTLARRNSYTTALDRHLADYPHDQSINEARFMKGQLEEQSQQSTAALPLYLKVEESHPRAAEAMAGAARCYEAVLRRMEERQLPTSEFEQEAIVSLSGFLAKANPAVDTWTISHAEIVLRLVSILLMDSIEPATVDNSAATEPADDVFLKKRRTDRTHQARDWLKKVKQFIDRNGADAALKEAVASLQSRSIPLEIIILLGAGNLVEAERILNSASTSPSQLLSIVTQLSRLSSTVPLNERPPLAKLQIRAAEKLLPLQDKLSAHEQEVLQRGLAHSYVALGQYPKAVELARRLSESASKDLRKQREWAMLLGQVPDNEAQRMAQQCWRRVESLSKPGSSEWLSARYEVLQGYVRMKQFEEGRKLLQITKVLYPELGGETLKAQFEAVEQQLKPGR